MSRELVARLICVNCGFDLGVARAEERAARCICPECLYNNHPSEGILRQPPQTIFEGSFEFKKFRGYNAYRGENK